VSRSPINLELFDQVIDFASTLQPDDGPEAMKNAPDLLNFCENLYAQFCQNALHFQITGFDSRNKAIVIAYRLESREPPLSQATIALLTWFAHLCDIEPDVKALRYGDADSPALPEFLDADVPTLLTRVHAWAAERNLPDLEAKADAAATALAAGLVRLQV